MIPWRKPSFGVSRVITSILKGSRGVDTEQVEALYAQVYGIPHAVLLPSCRAGIYWALKATGKAGTKVLCTAYTCTVVWEAIIHSGGKLDLIDVEQNSFLMDRLSLAEKQVGDYSIVLCEIYGYTYDLSEIARQATATPVIRIIDMAMTVPTREHFERLTESDFAVISFGAGKCMYAGWGGMAFTKDLELANRVRQIRDTSLSRCSRTLLIGDSLKMIALNFMYKQVTYGVLKRIKDAKHLMRQRVHNRSVSPSLYMDRDKPLSKEWFLPTTYVNRHLMLYNLRHAEEYSEQRILLAQRYHTNFKGMDGIICPQVPPYPVSHYSIRVKATLRPLIHKYLCKEGIDAGMLFGFPRSFPKDKFPRASRISCEVLNLPLNIDLSLSDIDRISESVVRACAKYN